MTKLDSKNNNDDKNEENNNENFNNFDYITKMGNISFTEEELGSLIDKIRDSDLSSLTEEEKEYLSKINRMMSLHHNTWTPFWESNNPNSTEPINISELELMTSNGGIGRVNIERMYHLYSELILLRNNLLTIKKTSTSSTTTTPSSSSLLSVEGNPLYYQLIGGLLGYVVMMRSTSGGWKDCNYQSMNAQKSPSSSPSSSPLIDSSTSLPLPSPSPPNLSDENIISQSPLSCLELLLQSTPIIDTNFRPLSVNQTISEWLHRSSISLPSPPISEERKISEINNNNNNNSNSSNSNSNSNANRRSKAIRALLLDVCTILSSRELILYILLDIWILCRIVIERENQGDDYKSRNHNDDNQEYEYEDSEDDSDDDDDDETREKENSSPPSIIQLLGPIACFPPLPSVSLVDLLTPFINSSSSNIGSSTKGQDSNKKNRKDLLIIDRFMKKILYLFNYFLIRSYCEDSSIDSWQERIFYEMKIYIQEYI